MKNKTYHIVTIGCQMNKNDSERIASYLEDLGFVYLEDKESSDLVIVTTCGVRKSAESRIYGLIPRLKQKNPDNTIILTGCLQGREDVKERLKKSVDIWMPITELPKLAEQLNMKSDNGSLDSYLNIKAKYESAFSAFVPIGNGCDNFCTYCVVPHARGREVYRPANEIINEVKSLVKKGYKEINLIAQNVNSYSDNSKQITDNRIIKFPDLLRMVNKVEGDFWIRFATSHPKDMSDELIQAIADSDKVCRHIHLPAQAGDNKILERMNRKYTVEHYKELIGKIRSVLNRDKSKPDVSITTDIIVGFPGESVEQFNNTKKLFEEVDFDMAYVAQFSPRPGTAAANIDDDVSVSEKKKREDELMEVIKRTSLSNNQNYLGKDIRVLVEGKKKGICTGRTETNKVVKFPSTQDLKIDDGLIGEFIDVKITEVKDLGLVARII